MREIDPTKLNFFSGANYMKRSEFVGSIDLTLPAYGGSVTAPPIEHNLRYIPQYTVQGELDEVDTIWNGGKVSQYTDQLFLSGLSVDETYPQLKSWMTTTTLTISLENFTSPTATGTRKIYWVIYLDYKL